MIFRNPYPDTVIPVLSVTEYVFVRAQELGDKPAIIDGPSGRALSYAQLAAAIRRVAAGLHERGLRKDELIIYVAERVAPYKRIHGVEFTDQIPKVASGKLLRRVLVERERSRIVGV